MTYYLEGNNDSNGFGFLIRNYTDKRKRYSIFEVLKELSTKNSISSKNISRDKSKIKTFSDERNLENSLSVYSLKELLKVIFQIEVNDSRRKLGTSRMKEEQKEQLTCETELNILILCFTKCVCWLKVTCITLSNKIFRI